MQVHGFREMVITKNISALLKPDINILNPLQFMFHAHHFHIEATFDIIHTDKLYKKYFIN